MPAPSSFIFFPGYCDQFYPFIAPDSTHSVRKPDLPPHLFLKQSLQHLYMHRFYILPPARGAAEQFMKQKCTDRLGYLPESFFLKHCGAVFPETHTLFLIPQDFLLQIASDLTDLFHRLGHVLYTLPVHILFQVRYHMPSYPVPCISVLQIRLVHAVRDSPLLKI